MKALKKFSIKTKTLSGDLAKQYFMVLQKEGKDDIVYIQKLFLTTDHEAIAYPGYTFLRIFRGKALLMNEYAILKDTLGVACNEIFGI